MHVRGVQCAVDARIAIVGASAGSHMAEAIGDGAERAGVTRPLHPVLVDRRAGAARGS